MAKDIGRKAMYFFPIKWPHFQWKKKWDEDENGMDHTNFKILKNGFTHSFTFETY